LIIVNIVRYEVFAALTMKNARVTPVRTDISEVLNASVIRVTRIGELGKR
jgi:hypothetical protein